MTGKRVSAAYSSSLTPASQPSLSRPFLHTFLTPTSSSECSSVPAETCLVPVETGWGLLPRVPWGDVFLSSQQNGWPNHSTCLKEGIKSRKVGGVPGNSISRGAASRHSDRTAAIPAGSTRLLLPQPRAAPAPVSLVLNGGGMVGLRSLHGVLHAAPGWRDITCEKRKALLPA